MKDTATSPVTPSIVSVAKVKGSAVNLAVYRALRLAGFDKLKLKGQNVVLKVNVVWDKLYPGCTTTPMVVEALIKKILPQKPRSVQIVDTDTAAIMNADKSFDLQGYRQLTRRYGIPVINLTHTPFKTVPNPQGKALKHLNVSQVLLNADVIITLPVPKMHQITRYTGALKNQWGTIHDLRHQHHLIVDQAIADVNLFWKKKIQFVLMDALFSMEGKGPKSGIPRRLGYILASSDRVALDAAATRMLGFQSGEVEHVTYSESSGVGTTNYRLRGDQLPTFHFKRATSKNVVIGFEFFLRHSPPAIKHLFIDSPLMWLMRYGAKWYYDLWYEAVGKKHAQRMMRTTYGRLWKTYLQ